MGVETGSKSRPPGSAPGGAGWSLEEEKQGRTSPGRGWVLPRTEGTAATSLSAVPRDRCLDCRVPAGFPGGK